MPARLLDPQSGACPDGLCFYSQHGHAASRLRTILHKKTKQALGFRFNLPHPLWLAPQIPVNLSFERKKGVKSMSRTRRHCVCVCVCGEREPTKGSRAASSTGGSQGALAPRQLRAKAHLSAGSAPCCAAVPRHKPSRSHGALHCMA